MSSTSIEVELSASGIKRAIAEIEKYKTWIKSRGEVLRSRVAELIAERARTGFNGASGEVLIGEAAIPADVSVTVEPGNDATLVIASGEEAVFVEFGAGIYYNTPAGSSPHPKGQELGLTIGSYGKGHGRQETWSFIGSDGARHYTHGTPASMPLYNAVMSVRNDLLEIAREVFD